MVYKNTRLTQKSKGSRMGKGTGAFYADAFNVKAGQLIFEFSHIEPKLLDNFLQDIKGKIPSKVEFVTRDSVYELNN
jgi:ribosomal protein L16/L10AE